MITAILGMLVGASFAAFLSSNPKDPALPLILAALGISAIAAVTQLANSGLSLINAIAVVILGPLLILTVAIAVASYMDE